MYDFYVNKKCFEIDKSIVLVCYVREKSSFEKDDFSESFLQVKRPTVIQNN